MNRCKKCFLPEGKFHVVLNDEGICNYCEYFEQNKQDILNITNREQILARRFQKLKGKYKYDAVVGLSGGKDSTYVICQMVKKYNLKVAAVTFDNGFLTNFARESIKNTVENLGVDHYYYKPNWNTHKKFYKAAVQKLGDPCIACAFGGYFLAIKACYENKIPFFIHGRTPFQMYRNFYKNSNDVFLVLMKLNLMEHSFAAMSNVYSMINEYAKQAISRIADSIQEAKEITDEFFVDSSKLTEEFVPEFLAYFLFEEYDEEQIKKSLEDTLNWRRSASDNLLGHYDCAIHDAATYMFKAINGVDVIEPDVAVMLRFGKISIEKATELIQVNQPTEYNVEKSLDFVCALCGLNREDLEKTLVALKQAGVSKFELGR
jgi:tRNA(Ile)-lysidine synthase TilS/MesJ